MKIAYLSTFYPFRGGIAQFNALLYQTFENQGHEVNAYTFSCQYPKILFPGKTQYVTEKDHAIIVDSKAILNTVNPFSYESAARKILDWAPDVLIMKYWMSFFAPSLGHVAKKLRKKGTKIVCVIDNAIPHEPKFFDKPLTRLFFNQCTHFVVMSDAVKKDLLQLKPDANYILKPHPLYNHFGEKCSRTDACRQLNIDENKKILLFFGLIRHYKGLDLLIDAMASLDESYQLVIAGECYGSFEKYEEQIKNSVAGERIKTMSHYIDDSLVPVLFSAADLLVLPYRSATQSGVIPVAYHFELPVLATDVGGLRETLEPPGTGMICEPNPESIAKNISSMFEIGIQDFINNIREEKKNLSWEKFSNEIIEFVKTS